MDTTLLVEAASKAGVLGPAMVDALARGETHFAAKEMSPEHLRAWITELKTDAPHFFAPVQPGPTPPPGGTPPDWLSPTEKMTWARTHSTAAPVSRRPGPFTPSPEQLKALEGKPPTERLSAYRQWQAEGQGGTP